MNRRFVVVCFALAAMLAAVLAWLAHLGPPGIRPGEDRVVALLTLTNGSRLCVVVHRTSHLIDAYEVSLYRLAANGGAARFYLGHEESYWWGSSLRASDAAPEVEIRSFWKAVACYSLADDVVNWRDRKRTQSLPQKASGDNILRLLAR